MQVEELELQRSKVEGWRAAEVPVLLLSMADAMWSPARVERAVANFAPCLGSVDLEWTPRLGVDMYKENQFHVLSSLREYGQTHAPAACCSYDVASSQCTQPSKTLYRGLEADAALRARAALVEGWLQREAFWQAEATSVRMGWEARKAARARAESKDDRAQRHDSRLSSAP